MRKLPNKTHYLAGFCLGTLEVHLTEFLKKCTKEIIGELTGIIAVAILSKLVKNSWTIHLKNYPRNHWK